MTETVNDDVVIVGGAIAGGALANALGSAGIRVRLIEKVSREVHSTRGDLLHPPTLRLLDRWQVLEPLLKDGALRIDELAVSHATQGFIARFHIRATGDGPASRTVAVPHDRIEHVLYTTAQRWPSVSVETGTVLRVLRDERGRPSGVRVRHGNGEEVDRTARIVVGCDGSRSLVRRELGISTASEAYSHEQVIISGEGDPELPAALHWYLDDLGALAVVNRPRGGFRILLTVPPGTGGGLLKGSDPRLRDYVVGRFPRLNSLRFGKASAYVYRLARHVADRFTVPGAALVGDSAQATHPAGATGMSLAITGAAFLADALVPLLRTDTPDTALDRALSIYDADRRPAAAAAVQANHDQALRLWQSDLFRDPQAYARAVDPESGWGVSSSGWGKDPAAIRSAPR